MPSFDIIKKILPIETFRVASIRGRFDIQNNQIIERFTGSLPIENEKWQIGVIYGHSGTGKTIIAKNIFKKFYFNSFKYKAKSIVDDMPANKTITEITKIFNSVGFSSPPSWLKPYSVLSQGEKMRVNLARALLSDKPLIVFDEFTSTVDRDIAKIASYAISKAIKRSNKKFIAVTCHFDILDWIEPDWTFTTNDFFFKKKI